MISELDAVIEAMVNRDRQAADEMRAQNNTEWSAPLTTPMPPRPKGARVKFTPSSSTSEPSSQQRREPS